LPWAFGFLVAVVVCSNADWTQIAGASTVASVFDPLLG
jgi:hypothetical protein